MKTQIKSLIMKMFKGYSEKEITFDGKNANVLGANGEGKTTIATAFYWMFADKDYDLHSNPAIRPIGVEECTPRVEVVLNVDGREVHVAKFQKCTKKKDGSISLSNSYEVNGVEYGERDFKKKLAEYDFEFDLFLPLSHPDVFTGQKSNDMRKVLFSMASNKSDEEIAYKTDGAGDVAKLLENYSMEEIKAMQNNSLKKIKEDYGKDGEILRAKIEGLETAKIDIDVAELELQRNAISELIVANKSKQEDLSKQYEEYDKLGSEILEMQFKLNDIARVANEVLVKQKMALRSTIDEKNSYLINISNSIQRNNREIAGYENDIESGTRERNRLAEQWKSVNAEQFDESTTICPTCHRYLPQEDKDRLLSEFEKSKTERLAKIEKDGSEVKADIDNAKAMIPKLKQCNEDNISNKEKLEKEVSDLEKQLAELPSAVDVSQNENYVKLQKQIMELEEKMSGSRLPDELKEKLKSEESELTTRLSEIERQIAKSENNIRIDEQISDLRDKQKAYEQQKANCDKILYQLDLVSKTKNELLTEEINKNFEIVKWQMFEYQKNGEYKECCVPLIDGKRFGESTNTGREILAKLDIIKGLQNFYSQNYPVFLDGAECLSKETKKRINMDCQIVYLEVAESELKVEVI